MYHAGDSLKADHANTAVLVEDSEKIVTAAQEIFRKQWQRVKNLE
jgi:hypothetical protein